MKPKVSVALCTFNGARYLREQLESIMVQTRLPDEIIVCDDASTDDSRDIVMASIGSNRVRVRLEHNEERLGVTRNFDKAISLCTGDIIFLADQDDVWYPHKLDRMLGAFARNRHAAYVFSNGDVINDAGQPIGATLWRLRGISPDEMTDQFPKRQLDWLLRSNVVTGCAMAFRSQLRRFISPIPEQWLHDWWIALLSSTFSFGVPVAESLIGYRKHSAQQVGMEAMRLSARMRESLRTRPEDYERRTYAAATLSARVHECAVVLQCNQQRLHQVDEMTRHLKRRAEGQQMSGFRRVGIVADEFFSGRYARYSGSWRSVVRDLCPLSFLDRLTEKNTENRVTHT